MALVALMVGSLLGARFAVASLGVASASIPVAVLTVAAFRLLTQAGVTIEALQDTATATGPDPEVDGVVGVEHVPPLPDDDEALARRRDIQQQ